ncbi:retrovirus-related Pol polyprotein from transposon TNT 1-94 [Trichonephila clavata]|uniref:Retrovirus-related Pol polyprotein from transposon TNT 1-94 n=1 Tax=Trichonephila clavata TaxID=2740835 RepID=A0A8X6HPG4_TRICU|nr:retrovirus-related Pol polyprotein from transposon TNT 1-94 [Trichonephila clavata]
MGEKYFLSIIDDFSRKAAVYPLREKSEVFEVVRLHITRVENFLDLKVKHFRSDNGSEFDNKRFETYFSSKGIHVELTNTYSPEQNGVIERYNQTVAAEARTLLSESGMSHEFWPEAMLHFTYTFNRVYHKGQTKTPFELFSGNKPSVRHLKPSGCTAYVGIPKQKRFKLDPRAVKGQIIGYAFRTRGYRIWIPEWNKVVETKNVSFEESIPFQKPHSGAVLEPVYLKFEPFEPFPDEDSRHEPIVKDASDKSSVATPESSENETDEDSPDTHKPSTKTVNWFRKLVPRPDGSRTDVYYYQEGCTKRLRTLKDIEKYCKDHNLTFDSDIFNFSQSNTFHGVIDGSKGDASSSLSQT